MASEAIDKKYLAGLKFTGGNKKGELETRALQPGDVLDWKENGNILTIVTADGKKHTVNKNKPVKADDPEKTE